MKKKTRLIIIITLIILLFGGSTILICLQPKDKNNPPVQDTKTDENNEKEPVKEDSTSSDKTNNESKPNEPEKNEESTTNNKPAKEEKPQESTTNTSKPEQKPTTEETPSSKPQEPVKEGQKPSSSETKPTTPTTPEETEAPEEKPSTNDKTPEEQPKEDPLDTARKSIEKTYGVKIKYGDEVGSYKPKGVTPVRLTDEEKIKTYLEKINTELAKYPKGFFEDFNKKGMPLTIYLVESVGGSFAGFTDYQFMNDIKLTMTISYEFEYTLHHELMHYIDCYLNIVMYPKTPYEEYEKLNPEGFTYGSATSSQIYHMVSNKTNAYFISAYGATLVQEDRAEVFKYIMARAYVPQGIFTDNPVLLQKARLISSQIKTYFPSVTNSAHWDRFI